MGLPTPVSFRNSQTNATALLANAPQKADAARDDDRFERHLDDSRTRETRQNDRRADRRDERRERDRAESDRTARSRSEDTRDAQKSGNDEAPVIDETQATDDAAAALAGMLDSSVENTDTENTETSEENDLGLSAQALPVDETPNDAGDEKSAETAGLGVDLTAKEAGKADAKAGKADLGEPAADDMTANRIDQAAAVNTPRETHKTDPKAVKTDPQQTAAPVQQSQAPIAASINAAPKADTPKLPAENTDPDAGLTITAKEGLGHEAAAKMADKSEAKANAAPQNGAAAQTAPQAAANQAGTQNFAKMVANASGGEVTSITSGSTSGATTNLSDLQNIGSSSQNQNANTATMRIGTLPGQSTPTQVPAMSIALQVARNLQKGINRFDIRLDPAEMGRIDVRMEVKRDGKVATHMIVERPETLDLLRRDSQALQQALNDAGLQADSDSLEFSLRDDNAGNSAENTSGQSQGGGLSNFEAAPEEVVMSPLYNVNLSANGGIDIRI